MTQKLSDKHSFYIRKISQKILRDNKKEGECQKKKRERKKRERKQKEERKKIERKRKKNKKRGRPTT